VRILWPDGAQVANAERFLVLYISSANIFQEIFKKGFAHVQFAR